MASSDSDASSENIEYSDSSDEDVTTNSVLKMNTDEKTRVAMASSLKNSSSTQLLNLSKKM